LDYSIVADVTYKISPSSEKLLRVFQSTDLYRGLRNFVGLEVSSYLNFTLAGEVMQKTRQSFTISLVPFRVYPIYNHLEAKWRDATDDFQLYNRLGVYVSLGELHTLYYTNWKTCGNSIVENGASNADDFLELFYCGYNSSTENVVEDVGLPGWNFNNYLGTRWEREWYLNEFNKVFL